MVPPRLPLDFFKTTIKIQRWKGRLGWIAAAVCVAWVGSGFLRHDEDPLRASPGRVSGVHQTWNDQCSVCHVPFQAMNSRSWTPFFLPFLSPAATQDQTCQTCHAGPDHHAAATPALSCGSCHREHRGGHVSLTRLPDLDCTQCHADLAAHGQKAASCGKDPPIHRAITGFSRQSHPAFRSVAKDLGQVNFTHKQHLTLGIPTLDPISGQPGGLLQRLEDIPKEFRERYRAQQPEGQRRDSDLVQLQCASCHRLDPGDFGLTDAQQRALPDGLQPPRGAGAYMLPITYENQCQACHPNQVTAALGPDGGGKDMSVPHRWQPEALTALLEDRFTAQAVRGLEVFEKKTTRPLPGKGDPPLLSASLKAKIQDNVRKAEVELFAAKKTCALCHQLEGKTTEAGATTWTVPATQIPQVWYRHARFDHSAHRAIDCRQCHAEADASQVSGDVLIPNIDNCVQCHAPADTVNGKKVGGARYDCTECHRYHNAIHPAQGLGAERRAAPRPAAIVEFLSGNAKGKKESVGK